MSTISQILNSFCHRINVPAPSSYVGVAQPAQQQYLSLLQFIGDNLRNRDFQWPQLKRGYYFDTAENVRKYQLPGDFYRILESTQWDTTNQWPMRGPISDYNFAVREFAVVSLQTRKAYRLIGPTQYLYSTAPYSQRSQGWFEIDPPGDSSADQLFLGYMSCNWVWPRDWVASTAYSLGDIRSGNGYVYICTTAGTSGTTRPSAATGTVTDGTVTWTVYIEPYPCNASNTKLNDNDLVLFDDDLMIEGMRWAYLRAKGLDYQQERSDWEAQVKSAFARFNGPIRINAADQLSDYLGDWPNVAVGSWNV